VVDEFPVEHVDHTSVIHRHAHAVAQPKRSHSRARAPPREARGRARSQWGVGPDERARPGRLGAARGQPREGLVEAPGREAAAEVAIAGAETPLGVARGVRDLEELPRALPKVGDLSLGGKPHYRVFDAADVDHPKVSYISKEKRRGSGKHRARHSQCL